MLNYVKIFADGASYDSIIKHNQNPLIQGFTTNPTLMYKAGVRHYEHFAKEVLKIIGDKPISFEVFSDDLDEMFRQACKISTWGKNVYVKIPITNTKGISTCGLIEELAGYNVKVNVTAITTLSQVVDASVALGEKDSFISIFAGRVADTGVDPYCLMDQSIYATSVFSDQKLIWASPRQVLDVVCADELEIDIITLTDDLINKLPLLGKDLKEYSLETVQMFYNDGVKAGFNL